MRVLIACEFSGTVRDVFRARGHDAWSCDLLPASSPFHIQRDCLQIIKRGAWDQCAQKYVTWDLLIAHPPCTFRNLASAWALKNADFERYPGVGYHQKVKPETLTGEARREARREADVFFKSLLDAPVERIAIENPLGLLSEIIPKYSQVIQPYQFGDDASKATCLWLKNLPKLIPTKYVEPRTVNGKPRWANQTDSGQNKLSPSGDRWAKRSVTYQGIALAMADQWGNDEFRLT